MRVLTVVLVLLGMFASCKKHLPELETQPFDYAVEGVGDVSVPANSAAFLGANVKLISGDPSNELITVSYENVPANIYIGQHASAFKASYRAFDSLAARNAVPGVYDMQMVFTNSSTGVKKYNFKLTITQPVNRAASFAGLYKLSNNCGFATYVSSRLDAVAGLTDQLRIVDRMKDVATGNDVFDTSYATVDCCTDSFTIAPQNVHGAMITGKGYLVGASTTTDKRVVLERTFVTDSNHYSCVVTLY